MGEPKLDLSCPICGGKEYAVTLMGWGSQKPEDNPNWIRCPCGFRDKMTAGQLYRLAQIEVECGVSFHRFTQEIRQYFGELSKASLPDDIREAFWGFYNYVRSCTEEQIQEGEIDLAISEVLRRISAMGKAG